MLNRNLVSVIIPVYNSENYLAEAINSVLAQDYQALEIILVDDGSTDGSAEVAHQFGNAIRYYRQVNSGTAAARNRGVELAHGEFLAFLDADDLWTEGKLSRQMQAFDDDPKLDMVFGYVQQFHSPELSEEIKQRIKIPVEISAGQHVGAMLVRRETFARVGSFNVRLNLAEIVDWYARATEMGLRSLTLPDVVMRRRLHKANQGTYNREHRSEYVRVLKEALDRRRNSNH